MKFRLGVEDLIAGRLPPSPVVKSHNPVVGPKDGHNEQINIQSKPRR
jgi:hypothetical protein